MIPPIRSTTQKPTFDFHQTSSTFVVSIYTRNPDLARENVIADLRRNKLTCLVLMPAKQLAYSLHLQFDDKDVSRYRF